MNPERGLRVGALHIPGTPQGEKPLNTWWQSWGIQEWGSERVLGLSREGSQVGRACFSPLILPLHSLPAGTERRLCSGTQTRTRIIKSLLRKNLRRWQRPMKYYLTVRLGVLQGPACPPCFHSLVVLLPKAKPPSHLLHDFYLRQHLIASSYRASHACLPDPGKHLGSWSEKSTAGVGNLAQW